MAKKSMKNLPAQDPYKSDLSFKPARDYIHKFLPSIERVVDGKKNRAKEIIRILDEAGKKSSILIPSIGPAKSKIVTELVKEYKPRNVYEIGTLFGYSAIVLAMHMPTDSIVTTIQKSRKNMVIAKRIIKAAGLSDRIRTVVGDATKVVPKFKDKIDMFLLDGYKLEYYKYLELVEPHLKIGSVVIADNVLVFENEMRDFLDHVRKSGMYKSKTKKTFRAFSKEKDAIEISIKQK